MMIIEVSMLIIFVCSLFIVVSSRINTHPIAKGIMCVLMISIVGVFGENSHSYGALSENTFAVTVALLVVYLTYSAYKRGSL